MILGILLLNTCALAIAVSTVLLTAANYDQLPDRVPIHFGITLRPDSWGPRPMIWLLPIMGLVAFGMLFALGFSTGKEQLMLGLINLQINAMFGVLTREQIQVAVGARERLSAAIWVLLGTILVTTLGLPHLT